MENTNSTAIQMFLYSPPRDQPYRRLGIMLSREGLVMNHKELLPPYREEGLRVSASRKALNLRADLRTALVIGWDNEITVQIESVA